MRNTVVKFFAAALAAASLTAFAAPTYAATASESSAQVQSGWCDVVPPFCLCNNQVNARCRCQPSVTVVKGREQGVCPLYKNED